MLKVKVHDDDPCISDDSAFENAIEMPDGSWAAPFVMLTADQYREHGQAANVNLFVCDCAGCKDKRDRVPRETFENEEDMEC